MFFLPKRNHVHSLFSFPFILLPSCLLFTSCATTTNINKRPTKSNTFKAKIARFFSTPTYSIHNLDKIKLEKRNNINRIYIRKNTGNEYGIYDDVIDSIKERLKNDNIELVDSVDKANFILNIKILSVATDIDYNAANTLRNTLTFADANVSFVFDNNNSPHISALKIDNITKNTTGFSGRKTMLPSVIYTMASSGVGFATGFLLAGTTAPITIGLASAVFLGGTTLYTYNTFKRVGVIVTYEIEIEERSDKAIQYNKKILLKSSANISEESFYTYNNNWRSYISKNIVVAIGSRVLIDDMLTNICSLVKENILDIFEKKQTQK